MPPTFDSNFRLIWIHNESGPSGIPAGYSRDNLYDNKAVQGSVSGSLTGGDTDHVHLFPEHGHTSTNHSHYVFSNTGGPLGIMSQFQFKFGAFAAPSISHHHSSISSESASIVYSSANPSGTTATSGIFPQHIRAIIIKPSGEESSIPSGTIAFTDLSTALTGFNVASGIDGYPNLDTLFVIGAPSGQDGGGVYGAVSGHIHVSSGTHGHPAGNHSHPTGVCGLASSLRTNDGVASPGYAEPAHHYVFLQSAPTSGTTEDYITTDASTSGLEPAYTKLLGIQTMGIDNIPSGLIFGYVGTSGSLDTDWWGICNGNSGTLDLSDTHIKITTNYTEIGDTDGSTNYHTHDSTHGHNGSGTHGHTVVATFFQDEHVRNSNAPTSNTFSYTSTHTHSWAATSVSGGSINDANLTTTSGDHRGPWRSMIWVRSKGAVPTPYSDSIDLYIGGHNITSGDTTLFINGIQLSLGNIDLYVKGYALNSSDVSLFLCGQNMSSDDTLLYLAGHQSGVDDTSLFVHGQDNQSGSCTLFIHGHSGVLGDTTLFIGGQTGASDTITLLMGGYDTSSDNIALFIGGNKSASGSADLYICGKDVVSGTYTLFTKGHSVSSGDTTLLIAGHQSGVNSVSLFVRGYEPVSGSVELFVGGYATMPGDIPLFSHGYNIASSSIDLFIRGHDVISDNITLFIGGTIDVSGSAPLYVCGHGDSADSIPLFIHGHDTVVSRLSTGTVVTWGLNNFGQCNVPPPNADFVSVAAGQYHGLGLKSNGSVMGWGRDDYGQSTVPLPNIDFVAVVGGGLHSLGVKASGPIVAWGYNSQGQCDVPLPNTNFVSAAGGGNHSLGLKSNGSVVTWGWGYFGQCNVPPPNANFVAVAAGGYHSLGLKSDGSIVAWGRNNYGQCDVPSPNINFVAIEAGSRHSLGLKTDGSIVGWGYNNQGQCDIPSPNTDFVVIAAGGYHSLGLKSDGSIIAWGMNVGGQCNVPLPNNCFTGISINGDYSLGLRTKYSGDLFIRGHETASGYIPLVMVGSGIIPYSGILTLVMNGYEPLGPDVCPILDPTASVQVSSSLIDIYQDRVDALLNQIGKNVVLQFDLKTTPCTNCYYDTMRKRSNGVYRSGGPRPFERGRRCPYCKGRGFLEEAVELCIKCLIQWNPAEISKFGISVQRDSEIIKLKTLVDNAPYLKRAKIAIIDRQVVDMVKYQAVLVKGPYPIGLREDRYCISFWETI